MEPLTLKLVLGIRICTTSSQKALANGDNDDDDTEKIHHDNLRWYRFIWNVVNHDSYLQYYIVSTTYIRENKSLLNVCW